MMNKYYKNRLCAGLLALMITVTSVGMVPATAKAEEADADTPTDISEVFEASDDIDVIDITNIKNTKLNFDGIVESVFSIDENTAAYDPRSKGRVTSVKDQGNLGLCWDYAANAAAESALIYQGLEKNTVDLSELYFAYATYKNQKSTKKFSDFCNAGNNAHSFNTKVNNEYIGKFASEADFPMPANVSDNYSLSDAQLDNYKYKVSRIYKIDDYKADKDTINKVKHLISEFGGVTWAFAQSDKYQKYASDSSSDTNYYCPKYEFTNHAVEIVGWDDNYPASNFINAPKGNGAWLVKNSWGVNTVVKTSIDWNAMKLVNKTTGSGYIWISYYNDSYGDSVNAMEVVPKGAETYEKKTVDVAINDSVDLNSLTKEKVHVWRNYINDNSYYIIQNTTIGCYSFGEKEYKAYDEYDNLLGVYTINVIAGKDAELKLNIKQELNSGVEMVSEGSCSDGKIFRIKMTADKLGTGLDYAATLCGETVTADVDTTNTDVISNANGKLKIAGFGKTKLTSCYKDDKITNGKTFYDSYIIYVDEICSAIEWDDHSYYKHVDIDSGDTYQLSGITTKPNGQELVYRSLDENVVTVTDAGLVKAVGYGSTLVEIKPKNNDALSIMLDVMVNEHYNPESGDIDDTDDIIETGDITEYYETPYVNEYYDDGYNEEGVPQIYTQPYVNQYIGNETYTQGEMNDNGYKRIKKAGKTKLSSVKKNKNKVCIEYKAANADFYEIQVSANKKFTKGVKKYSTSDNSFVIKKLKKGKNYYVRVRAYNKAYDGSKVNGKWSTVKKVKLKK